VTKLLFSSMKKEQPPGVDMVDMNKNNQSK